jgi:hypothetical protein
MTRKQELAIFQHLDKYWASPDSIAQALGIPKDVVRKFLKKHKRHLRKSKYQGYSALSFSCFSPYMLVKTFGRAAWRYLDAPPKARKLKL